MSADAWHVRAARPTDLADIVALVQCAGLPAEDLATADAFTLACAGEDLVGAAGVERYGDAGLLRSVVVDRAWRGRGIAGTLLDAALERARRAHVTRVYLLTTTAAEWFAARGFTAMERVALPPAIAAAPQAARICPASATVMQRVL